MTPEQQQLMQQLQAMGGSAQQMPGQTAMPQVRQPQMGQPQMQRPPMAGPPMGQPQRPPTAAFPPMGQPPTAAFPPMGQPQRPPTAAFAPVNAGSQPWAAPPQRQGGDEELMRELEAMREEAEGAIKAQKKTELPETDEPEEPVAKKKEEDDEDEDEDEEEEDA